MTNNPLKLLLEELESLASDYIKKYFESKDITGLNKQAAGRELPDSYKFSIGGIDIENPVISAPLAGISDNTFRIFARAFGCSLTFSEMVTSYGLHYNHRKSKELTSITEHERLCALQLFGSEPEIMAEAALKVQDSADIIDVNMGCPVPKILKAKSGGYLMKEEDKVKKIISSMVSVLKKPLTVKTRIGWNREDLNVVKIARIAEEAGAGAITIHGRTVRQGFSGEVDYEIIGKVKDSVNIPVIASGDIETPAKALEVLKSTGCDGIMIGRAAKGTLWLLQEMVLFLLLKEKGIDIGKFSDFIPDEEWKKKFAGLYFRFLVNFKGEFKAVREFRKHLSWIFKGVRGITKVRKKFFLIDSTDDALEIIDSIKVLADKQ